MEEKKILKPNFEINEGSKSIIVSLNPKLYFVDVILSTAYLFTDSCYVLIDGDPEEEIILELRLKKEGMNLEKLGREFNNELINYAAYNEQSAKNANLREAILTRALLTNSPSLLQRPVEDNEKLTEEADCLEEDGTLDIDDPEGIAVPWDDKYEKSDSGEEVESFDFDDPEGIAVPWEEKYGENKDKQGC